MQTVIFDLDGTLTDSGEGIKNSAIFALERLGLPVPERTELRKMVGPPLSVGFALLGVPENLVDEAVRLYRERYNEGGGKYENRVYDGIEDCLKALKAAGARLFVGTSKPEPLAQEILERFGLAPYFDYIAGATWDKRRQNKDDVLRYLLEMIGADSGAIMVGDTHYDVTGAHARGIPCIGVTWGYGTRNELSEADAVVDSPEELSAYLLSEKTEMNEQTRIENDALLAFWDRTLAPTERIFGPEEIIRLRPHHGMCFQFYEGKGYSAEFTDHMGCVIRDLSERPKTSVRLTLSTDAVCERCPNNINGTCQSAEKVTRYDKAVLSACNLSDGEELTYADFAALVKERILDAGLRRNICGDCEWDAICAKHRREP